MKSSITLLVLFAISSAWAAPVRDKHVSAELISEVSTIQAGKSFRVAIKLTHDEHWHTYWINDGDSGLPTRIKWTLPDGFSAGPIIWPFPQRIEMLPLVSFGYEGEAWLMTEITPPAQISETNIQLQANVSWLMCKEICIPGRALLSLSLPVTEIAQPNAAAVDSFAAAQRLIPSTATDWSFTAHLQDDVLILSARSPRASDTVNSIAVFSLEKEVVSNSAQPVIDKTEDGYVIALKREQAEGGGLTNFHAVLVAEPTMAKDGFPALEINVPLTPKEATLTTTTTAATSRPVPERSLMLICVFAFLGGIILNLMPCVFPVISLKILGFVKQAGENPREVWHHGLVFALGVLVSFWILAGVLIALRASGATIGWGFQLQSPTVLIVLCLLFFTLALNLFGVFELGLSLTTAGGGIAPKQGWAGSFFSGFLATVIATPCTAPFMGVALGYALTQPPFVAMAVFTSLALGMAAPYLLLSRYPALLNKLPRPGAWMETMKQAMGFLLMATVVWLMWVLAALTTSITTNAVLAAFLLISIGTWILGKWDTLSRNAGVRWRARIMGWAMLALAIFVGFQYTEKSVAAGPDVSSEWIAFTPEKLAELRSSGKPVFIDFTAKWCLTCQVNKLTVLRTEDVMNAFREKNVTLMVADWTDENDVIARELARHGRQSVPVYALYHGTAEEPHILPELLTRKIVIDALQKLN